MNIVYVFFWITNFLCCSWFDKNGKEYKACYKDQFAWILRVLYGVCT